MIFLQTAFQSGLIGGLLQRWQEIGFFSYLLPFLIIFAMVFGILTKTNIFKDNKMINGIIALAVALMALQFDFVPTFFSEIFPRLGVGLAVLLGIFIILGLFLDEKTRALNWILLGIGVIIFYFILVQSAGATGWTSGQWWSEHWGEILAGVLLVVFVVAMIGSGGKKQETSAPQYTSPIWSR